MYNSESYLQYEVNYYYQLKSTNKKVFIFLFLRLCSEKWMKILLIWNNVCN